MREPGTKWTPPESKLTVAEQYDVYCKRQAGVTFAALAAHYDVSDKSIYRYVEKIEKKIKEEGLEKLRAEVDKVIEEAAKIQSNRSALKTDMTEFARKAKSILWKQETGKDRPSYDLWQSNVKKMVSTGLSKAQAVIQTSKGFPCLEDLFAEYDTSRSDPDPDYNPAEADKEVPKAEIACDNKEQTHRENLTWAIEAAGKFLRTKKRPSTAPNDAAYFLFTQACDDPKDFLSRFTQVDMKGGDTGEEETLMMRSGTKSIAEIDDMLESLTKKERD